MQLDLETCAFSAFFPLSMVAGLQQEIYSRRILGPRVSCSASRAEFFCFVCLFYFYSLPYSYHREQWISALLILGMGSFPVCPSLGRWILLLSLPQKQWIFTCTREENVCYFCSRGLKLLLLKIQRLG